MIIDRQPCPVCKALPRPDPDWSAVPIFDPTSHKPQAQILDVSHQGGPELLHTLWFRCLRCKARWVATPERWEEVAE